MESDESYRRQLEQALKDKKILRKHAKKLEERHRDFAVTLRELLEGLGMLQDGKELEVDDMVCCVQQACVEVRRRSEHAEAQERTVAVTKSEAEQLKAQCEGFQQQLTELRHIVERSPSVQHSVDTHNNQLQKRVSELEAVLKEKEGARWHAARLETAECERDAIALEKLRLQAEVEELRSDLDVHTQKSASMITKHKQMQQENELLQNELAEWKGMLVDMQQDLKRITAHAECVENEKEAVQKTLSSINAELSEKLNALAYAEARIVEIQRESGVSREADMQEIASLQAQLYSWQHRAEESDQTLRSCQEEMQTLRSQGARWREHADQQTVAWVSRIKALEAQIADTVHENQQMFEDNQALRTQVQSLEATCMHKEDHDVQLVLGEAAAVAQLRESVATAQAALKERAMQIADIRAQNEALAVEIAEGKQRAEHALALAEAAAKSEGNRMQRQVTMLQSKVALLEQERESSAERIQTLTEQLGERLLGLKEDRDRAYAEVMRLREELQARKAHEDAHGLIPPERLECTDTCTQTLNESVTADACVNTEESTAEEVQLVPPAKRASDDEINPEITTKAEIRKEEHSPTSSVSAPEDSGRSCTGTDDLEALEKQAHNNKWMEVEHTFPAPPYGLESPVIDHLIGEWSKDVKKVAFLRDWLHTLCFKADSSQPLPKDFPSGLQLVELTAEVRDGFMMLLVPIAKAHSHWPFRVYMRQSVTTTATSEKAGSTELWDLRIKLIKPIATPIPSSNDSKPEMKANTLTPSIAEENRPIQSHSTDSEAVAAAKRETKDEAVETVADRIARKLSAIRQM